MESGSSVEEKKNIPLNTAFYCKSWSGTEENIFCTFKFLLLRLLQLWESKKVCETWMTSFLLNFMNGSNLYTSTVGIPERRWINAEGFSSLLLMVVKKNFSRSADDFFFAFVKGDSLKGELFKIEWDAIKLRNPSKCCIYCYF